MMRPASARFPSLSRRLARNRDGATAVEFSLVLPLLLAFVFGIIETGHLLWTIGALNMAVQDAARCVSVSNASTSLTPCATQTAMQTYASTRSWGITVPASDFALTQPACGYEVTVTYPYTPVVSYIPLSMTLTATACYPLWQ